MKYFKTYFLFFGLSVLLFSCKENKTSDQTLETNKTEDVAEPEVLNQKLNATQQIASAVLAAPEETRSNAKVYGYDEEGEFITLREGANDMICIADDPNKEGFEVVSYHKDLEPYMARGRALKAEGKAFGDRRDMREKEAIAGTLKMPSTSAILHILHGKDGYFDLDSLKVKNAKYRYVVYIPFATQASTGLSLSPNAPGHPWLMFPGKANAHIMITPPSEDTK